MATLDENRNPYQSDHTPLYYVVVESVANWAAYVSLRIISVHAIEAWQLQGAYAAYVVPLLQTHPNANTLLFQREPQNPFRDAVNESPLSKSQETEAAFDYTKDAAW